MKKLFFIGCLQIVSVAVLGQHWDGERICSSDTLIVLPYEPIQHISYKGDSTNLEPYKVVQCKARSIVAFRVEIGYSRFYYDEEMKSWIGNHGSPNFNVSFAIDKLNFGYRFKPWTVNPKKELGFDGQMMPKDVDMNVIKSDFYVGYSFDLPKLISIEPYAGYSISSFHTINENTTNQKFELDKTGGLILGITLNKYFRIKDYEYLAVFGSSGYAFVDYEKISPELDSHYFEWTVGVAYKGFLTKHFNKKVD